MCPQRYQTRERLFFGVTTLEQDECDCPHELARNNERDAHVLICDLNYLLYASQISHRPAIMILDEVQQLTQRVQESCTLSLSVSKLREFLSALPRGSSRARYAPLLSPEWHDDLLSTTPLPLLRELSHELARSDAASEQTLAVLRRILALASQDPALIQCSWYRSNASSGWLLKPISAARIIESLFSHAEAVVALSGSLPESPDALRIILPGFDDYRIISAEHETQFPVSFVPTLDFRYPISLRDIGDAVELLSRLHAELRGCVLTYAPNRDSAWLIADALRVRGFSVLLDRDLSNSIESLSDYAPDFLLTSLGSSFAESVNPPPRALSCLAILASGHLPPDKVSDHRNFISHEVSAHDESETAAREASVLLAASRVIQAAGRAQRSPESAAPVFLLNRASVDPGFMKLWPRHWKSTNEFCIVDDLSGAFATIREISERTQ
jgi:Rad3-related DNA helicase